MIKSNIAILFGGMSPEHEISIITAVQAMNALNRDKYNLFPVYISKKGVWYLGDKNFLKIGSFKNLGSGQIKAKRIIFSLDYKNNWIMVKKPPFGKLSPIKIDLAIPIFHGRNGEDGTIQGILETAGIPYVGCDVMSSAIGIDKEIAKTVAQSINIPTLKGHCIQKNNWENNSKLAVKNICAEVEFPMFIKPAHLGSSIGISKVHNQKELINALEVAFCYDSKILAEKSLENTREVNISVVGNNPYEVSPTEMPITDSEILSFEDKYTSNSKGAKGMASAKRIIPAPIKISTKQIIEKYAREFFTKIGGQGLARIDFLISKNEKEVYFNEINTIPGSLSFYLWKKKGISFGNLLDKLIRLALQKAKEKDCQITSFESGILENYQSQKGVKN